MVLRTVDSWSVCGEQVIENKQKQKIYIYIKLDSIESQGGSYKKSTVEYKLENVKITPK
jgi:hypothetical protein